MCQKLSIRHQKSLNFALQELLDRLPGEILSIYLYGSCARNKAHYNSDIDLLVLLRKECTLHPRELAFLKAEIVPQDYTLPDIDIHFYRGKLEEQEDNPYFRNIRKDGIQIWTMKH